MPSAKENLFNSIVAIIANYNTLDKDVINNIINDGIQDIIKINNSLEFNEDLNIAKGDLLNQLKANGANFDQNAYNNVLNQYLNIKNTRNLNQPNKPKDPQSFDLVEEDLDEEPNYLNNNKPAELRGVEGGSPKIINSKQSDTYAEPNKEPELINDDLTAKDVIKEEPIVNLSSSKNTDAKIIEPASPEITDKKPKKTKELKHKKIKKSKKPKDSTQQKDPAQITQELINLIEEASQLAHVDESLPREQFVKTLQENLIKISNDLSHKISSHFR